MTIDLRLGKWQDALADVEVVDALITDCPYSERTHSGHDSATNVWRPGEEGEPRDNLKRQALGLDPRRKAISYAAWTESDVCEFVAHWGPRVRGWFATITDHVLAPIFAAAMEAPANGGRYVFAPVPIVEIGSRVRLSGDGPSSWSCYLVVARPKNREFQRWGTLPGAYVGSGKGDREHIGGKDSGIMRAIVRDYSRLGDLICDPCAGAATTLVAAAMEGRRAIGSEMDPNTFAKAKARIARGYTPTLFAGAPAAEQLGLLGEK